MASCNKICCKKCEYYLDKKNCPKKLNRKKCYQKSCYNSCCYKDINLTVKQDVVCIATVREIPNDLSSCIIGYKYTMQVIITNCTNHKINCLRIHEVLTKKPGTTLVGTPVVCSDVPGEVTVNIDMSTSTSNSLVSPTSCLSSHKSVKIVYTFMVDISKIETINILHSILDIHAHCFKPTIYKVPLPLPEICMY